MVTKKQTGFTIVELLIVIVVIGILAAITIVAYNGIQNRAYDTAVKNDLNSFATKIEIVKLDTSDGSYPAYFDKDMGFKFSRSAYGLDYQGRTLRYCRDMAADDYVMMAVSKSGNYFQYTKTGGLETSFPKYGYDVCGKIGLTATNPTANGLYQTTWANWVN